MNWEIDEITLRGDSARIDLRAIGDPRKSYMMLRDRGVEGVLLQYDSVMVDDPLAIIDQAREEFALLNTRAEEIIEYDLSQG